jgi:2-polyprenyl-6-methoxyphenol hydroxylase-like FAD-dependent oxidoreductase
MVTSTLLSFSRSLPDLRALLPTDLGDMRQASVNYGIPDLDRIALLDASTGEHIATLGGVPDGKPGNLLRVGRERLRCYLWQNLPVTMGKKFSHYTEDGNGVTAYFHDSSSVRGSMLVGADGAHSLVRKQILGGQCQLARSNLIPIVGLCELPREIYEPFHKLGSAAIISSGPQIRYLIGTRAVQEDRSSASYYYALCFRSERPEVDSVWAETASKEELYNKALELTKDMPPLLRSMVEQTGPANIPTPPLRFVEFVPPPYLPRGRVTLLGDAAHSMIPFCLAGANTAVQDACDLGRLIAQGVKEGQEMDWLLHEYENKMLPRGKKNVLASRAVGDIGDLTAMVEGRINTKDLLDVVEM